MLHITQTAPLRAAAEREASSAGWRLHSTTIAAIAVAISTITLCIVGVVALHQANQIKAVSHRVCIASNANRYGGVDYLRPVIRAGLIRHGDDDLAKQITDIPAIDCSTGLLIPLPSSAQR